MKDGDGRVRVEHFYDGVVPLSALERQAIAAAPNVDAELMRDMWLGRTEGGGKTLAELINLPSLNIRGFASGHIGAQAANVIPSSATAAIDLRLVKGVGHQQQADRVVAHIRKQGYYVTTSEPDQATRLAHPKVAWVAIEPSGYDAVRTPMDLPAAQRVIAAVRSVRSSDRAPAHRRRQRAAGDDRGHPRRQDHFGADRELRQQPTQCERKYSARPSLGRHRDAGRAVDDGMTRMLVASDIRVRTRIAWIVGALLVDAVVLGAGQEATFKAAIRTVAVYATVTGADGRLLPDLSREAFTVLDNGKPQALTLFANDVQPITVVMLLDRSVSMRANFTLVQQAAERFVDALQPSDKARIGSFSNRIQVDPREFTSDHAELLTILRTELQEEGPTPLWNAVNVGITALLHQQGRRVILVFTDGMDSPAGGFNNLSLKDVMKRAEEEDTMVYAIGLVGSTGFGPGGGRRR